MSSSPLAPWLQPQLVALLAQNSPALLLQGPSGLGQWALGLALVRAGLCERPTQAGACGSCESCHAIDVHTHADLCVLMPQASLQALGWPIPNAKASDADGAEKAPKLSREIRIDDLRDAIEFTQRTSARGRGKAVLIYPAERMNSATANALLKTLEEPPSGVRFVLASEAAHLLLPTIRSRCISHTLAWPDEAQALAWLHAQGLDAAAAKVQLRAAGGRPDNALAASQAGLDVQQLRQLPQALRHGQPGALAGLSPGQAVDRLQKLCHDMLARHVGTSPRFFEVADLPTRQGAKHRTAGVNPAQPDPQTASQTSGLPALLAWSKALTHSARIAEHPLNVSLMLESLAQQAHHALDCYLRNDPA
ncbi:MAG: DNA polymerase III subunit delta' [Burkholderiales bacterium]